MEEFSHIEQNTDYLYNYYQQKNYSHPPSWMMKKYFAPHPSMTPKMPPHGNMPEVMKLDLLTSAAWSVQTQKFIFFHYSRISLYQHAWFP